MQNRTISDRNICQYFSHLKTFVIVGYETTFTIFYVHLKNMENNENFNFTVHRNKNFIATEMSDCCVTFKKTAELAPVLLFGKLVPGSLSKRNMSQNVLQKTKYLSR